MKRVLWLWVLCVLLGVNLGAVPPSVQDRQDRILVRFKPGQAPGGDLRPMGRVTRRFSGVEGLELIQLEPGVRVSVALRVYREDGRVQYAQPDHAHRKWALPNDANLGSRDAWHLANDGRNRGKVGADIRAEAAWAIRHDAPDVVVAVLDSGIRHTHEDLAGNMWRNLGEVAGDGLDNDGNGVVDDVHGYNAVNDTGSVMDDDGHGTFVAGLIGAVGNNGKGVAGVCWSVKLMAVKVLDAAGGGYDSDILAGMEYARNNGANILNMSLGSIGPANPALQEEIVRLKAAGVLVVVAAGNESFDTEFDRDVSAYPAAFRSENLISVGASTRNDLLATFSNYGVARVGLVAPGVDLPSTSSGSDSAYAVQSGTSFSAPLVAGALALMKAELPSMNHRQLVERLLSTVDPQPALSGKCLSAGRLNLERALSGAAGPRPYNGRFVKRLPIGGVFFGGSGVTLNSPDEFDTESSPSKALWWSWYSSNKGSIRLTFSAGAGPESGYPDFDAFVYSRQLGEYQRVAQSSGEAEVEFEVLKGELVVFRLGSASGQGGAVGFRGRYVDAGEGFGQFALLSVSSSGSGTASPLGDLTKKVGDTVLLKAAPAKGYILQGWYDLGAETADDALLSVEPSFKYTVAAPGYIGIQAVFTPDPFRSRKGSYNGMATTPDGSDAASFKMDLGAAGAFSASIRVRGVVYAFKGVMRSDFKYEFQKVISGQRVVLVLELDNERRMSGTLSVNGAPPWELFAEANDFDPFLNPNLSVGDYTVELPVADGSADPGLPSPGGTGAGVLTVSFYGAVRFAGNLGDGFPVSQGTSLLRIGRWPFYATTYTAASAVFGWVDFDEDAESTDLSGDLRWVKPPRARDSLYPAGFTTRIALSGARYYAPESSGRVLELANQINNAFIHFTGGGLVEPLGSEFTLGTGTSVTAPAALKLAVNPKNGLFSGTFLEAARIPARAFRGVFQQKRGLGVGYFLRAPSSGKVEIGAPPL